MADLNPIKDAAEAVEGLAKAVPVYQDLAQPAVREVGTVLGRAVHAALAPMRGLLWSWEQVEEHFIPLLVEKLKRVPHERVSTPSLHIAGPALNAMRFTGSEPSLRELYANLLATAMDEKVKSGAHPAFVDVINQLTPDEAKIVSMFARQRGTPTARPLISIYARIPGETGKAEVLRHFSLMGVEAGCVSPQHTQMYLENLCRLGVAEIPSALWHSNSAVYTQLEEHPQIIELKTRISASGREPKIEREMLRITAFGAQFIVACAIEPEA